MNPFLFWTIMFALDGAAFIMGALVWSTIRNRLLSENVIRLQRDVIGLQSMNLLLNQELSAMREEIRQLRSDLSAEQSAFRHFRNNIAQVFQSRSDILEVESRGLR